MPKVLRCAICCINWCQLAQLNKLFSTILALNSKQTIAHLREAM
ncbi:MAG: hypothetical protein V7K35_11685 [Nostoc sp.]